MSTGPNLWQMGGSEATTRSESLWYARVLWIKRPQKERSVTWRIELHFAPKTWQAILGVVWCRSIWEKYPIVKATPTPFHESMKQFIPLLTIQAFRNHPESQTILGVKKARLRCVYKLLQVAVFFSEIEGHWQVKLIPKLDASNWAQNRAVLLRLKRAII